MASSIEGSKDTSPAQWTNDVDGGRELRQVGEVGFEDLDPRLSQRHRVAAERVAGGG